MSELAGFIGWCLSSFHDWLAPNGLSKKRAVLFLLFMAALSAGLFYVAWPDGLES